MQQQPQQQNAPGKCKIVAGIYVVGGILVALVALAFVALADAVAGLGGLGSLGLAAAGIFFVLAAVQFAIAYGLWHVKQWGWYAAAILTALGLLGQIAGLTSGISAGAIVSLAILVFIAYALYDESAWYGINF